MTKTSEPIVFFGNERLATGVITSAPILRALIENGYNIRAIVSNYERSTSRSGRDLEIAQVARKHNIPIFLPKKISEIKDQLAGYNAAAGVLVAYGKIVPESVINIFPYGIINLHPSLLPKHRGSTPIESAILHGDKKTGVSIMQLAKAMDAGPVFAQAEVSLQGNETKQALADHLSEVGSAILLDILPGILSGKVVALPQDHSQATYDSLLTNNSGLLDWNKSALQLEREVRAFATWPKSRTRFKELEVIVTKTRVLDLSGKPGKTSIVEKLPVVFCKSGALALEQIKPAGKKEMTGEAFLAGYKNLFLSS